MIVGHSERRQLFGEDDATVNKKVRAVVAHAMTPIVCVGETLEERDAGGTESKVAQQVRRAFDGVDAAAARTSIVAYEPIWAIGTGRNAEPADAGRVVELIRDTLGRPRTATRVGRGGARAVRRQRQAGQHPRVHGPSGDRRRVGRRGEPRSRRPHADREVRMSGAVR